MKAAFLKGKAAHHLNHPTNASRRLSEPPPLQASCQKRRARRWLARESRGERVAFPAVYQWYPGEIFQHSLDQSASISARADEKENNSIMMSQQNTSASRDEPPESRYGRYEGEPPSAGQREQLPGLQFQEERAEKIYQPTRDMTMFYRLLTMVFALVALVVFVYICLILVGGTAGIVGFCAASFTIMVLASTMLSVKREGEK